VSQTVKVKPLARGLNGKIQVPGDKSVSHRAIMLASLAHGSSAISGFLEGEDTRNTARAFAAMGVRIDTPSAHERVVHGVGLHGLTAPDGPLDLGNAGTGMRLIAGVMAAQRFDSTLIGDASLSARPMRRIIEPLREMGAIIRARDDAFPPLQISGGNALRGIRYAPTVPSAQIKSCVLLAGLYAGQDTTVLEPVGTRDYTESMLRTFGAEVQSSERSITLRAGARLKASNVVIPGDFSSAAFWIVAASIVPDSDLLIEQVGLNRYRLGLIDALRSMGANIDVRAGSNPDIGQIRVRSAELAGVDLDPALVPNMIDEFPVFFVAASLARGRTHVRGAHELRVKESDRIAVMARALSGAGALIQETEDGAIIDGVKRLRGDVGVDSAGDHRCAMSMAIAAMVSEKPISVRDCANVNTSYPNFWATASALGVDLEH